jgi:oligopeptide/dipeptide ABC transporter ATP-binding protein
MSGGQKQRVMIAVALAAEPDFLIADEPTTALDVTIQAQILDLLRDLQREKRMGLLLITHDLAVVSGMAHRVALMYAGQVIEVAPAEEFFRAPRHPYARALLRALPGGDRRAGPLEAIAGTVPALTQSFAGCRFAPRCIQAMPHCTSTMPQLQAVSPSHEVRCLLYVDGATQGGPEPAQAAAPPASAERAATVAGAPAAGAQPGREQCRGVTAHRKEHSVRKAHFTQIGHDQIKAIGHHRKDRHQHERTVDRPGATREGGRKKQQCCQSRHKQISESSHHDCSATSQRAPAARPPGRRTRTAISTTKAAAVV